MSIVDKRGILDEEIFSYRISKDNKVFISYEGKQVTILNGKKADDFIRKILNTSDKEAQLIMAKITGNFKRGNEKLSKHSNKR
jgi:DNA polymerase II small subunit/DNA polymerase delta subunit B